MAEYIFDDHQAEQERQRLQLIEHALDPLTVVHLDRTGVTVGWRCLEVGAGAGSIMRWMGRVVGHDGLVVGVDKSAGYLHDLTEPPYQVVEGKLTEVDLDPGFDLLHSRYVLIHNAERRDMLRRYAELLKPGGFLVVEEPEFTSAVRLDVGGDESQQGVGRAICRMFESIDLDPSYGLKLPADVISAGLKIIEVDARLHLERGGSPVARMMGASARALMAKYVATGEASESDIDRYVDNSHNDRFWAVYYSTVSVIAVK